MDENLTSGSFLMDRCILPLEKGNKKFLFKNLLFSKLERAKLHFSFFFLGIVAWNGNGNDIDNDNDNDWNVCSHILYHKYLSL